MEVSKVKEKIISLVGDQLDSLGVTIDDAYVEKEGSETFLRIVLDREEVIPLNTVVMATRILNPIIDKVPDLVEGTYILDVYAKEKGDK